MSWQLTVFALGILCTGVASVALYLWSQRLMASNRNDELARRLDRLEGEVRTQATASKTAAPLPSMGVFGVKR